MRSGERGGREVASLGVASREERVGFFETFSHRIILFLALVVSARGRSAYIPSLSSTFPRRSKRNQLRCAREEAPLKLKSRLISCLPSLLPPLLFLACLCSAAPPSIPPPHLPSVLLSIALSRLLPLPSSSLLSLSPSDPPLPFLLLSLSLSPGQDRTSTW